MKSLFTKQGCWLVGLAIIVLVVSSAEAATRRITFPNNTGQNANDLHVEFVQASTPNPPGGPFGAFPNENGGGTSRIDFSGGTVNNGANTSITFTNGASRIRVKRWWWTLNGRRIGRIMRERNLAMITFDQTDIRLSETATIELYAAAALDKDSVFEVMYSIDTSDGQSFAMLPVDISVIAGTEQHQQLLTVPLPDAGTYTITYSTTDVETGEEVSSGTSSVTIDSGVHPLPEPSQQEDITQIP